MKKTNINIMMKMVNYNIVIHHLVLELKKKKIHN